MNIILHMNHREIFIKIHCQIFSFPVLLRKPLDIPSRIRFHPMLGFKPKYKISLIEKIAVSRELLGPHSYSWAQTVANLSFLKNDRIDFKIIIKKSAIFF